MSKKVNLPLSLCKNKKVLYAVIDNIIKQNKDLETIILPVEVKGFDLSKIKGGNNIDFIMPGDQEPGDQEPGDQDLTILKGIGEKLKEVLNGEGIYTISDLLLQTSDQWDNLENKVPGLLRKREKYNWLQYKK